MVEIKVIEEELYDALEHEVLTVNLLNVFGSLITNKRKEIGSILLYP